MLDRSDCRTCLQLRASLGHIPNVQTHRGSKGLGDGGARGLRGGVHPPPLVAELLEAPKTIVGLTSLAPNKILIGRRPGRKFGPICSGGGGSGPGGGFPPVCPPPPPSGGGKLLKRALAPEPATTFMSMLLVFETCASSRRPSATIGGWSSLMNSSSVSKFAGVVRCRCTLPLMPGCTMRAQMLCTAVTFPAARPSLDAAFRHSLTRGIAFSVEGAAPIGGPRQPPEGAGRYGAYDMCEGTADI